MNDLYRAILRIYPDSYRAAYGDDLLATARELHGDRFSVREGVSLASNGLRQRVLATTEGSAGATWRRSLHLATWFSLLNWMTFRLLNAWQAVRLDGNFAGRDRPRIGNADVVFPRFHPEVGWTPGNNDVVFAIAVALIAVMVLTLFLRAGPMAVGLAALASIGPPLLIETTVADVLIFVPHVAVVAWFAAQGERNRILAVGPMLVFVATTASFAFYINPRSPKFEHVWGIAEMVGLGFFWGLFSLAGVLLIAHDPRMLPLSAIVYGLLLLQVLLPAIGDGEIVSNTTITAAVAQVVVLAVLGLVASTWGNRRVLRV